MRELEPTKRNIVGIATRFYDPLGFVSPITIRFKMLFQELCQNKVGWDEPLSGDLLSRWKSLASNLQGLSISIPRCYFNSVERSLSICSLQGFCDASTGAYAAVVYLKIVAGTEVSVKFVASKTRVSPVNKQTIPRLELLAALLLAKLITAISDALEPEITLSEFTCFTDSKVSLYWIRGMDRVETIRAKQGQRDKKTLASEYLEALPWKRKSCRHSISWDQSFGALWKHSVVTWTGLVGISRLEHQGGGVKHARRVRTRNEKHKDRKLVHSMLITEKSRISLSEIIDCEMFGDLHRLLRVTAYVLKFINLLQHKVGKLTTPLTKNLTAADVAQVKRLWLRGSQRTLPEEKQFEAWKWQFGLFIDKDGLYRCQGILSNADLTFSAKHPILLPKKHHLTVLLVKHSHKRVMHNGVKETLTELRSIGLFVEDNLYDTCCTLVLFVAELTVCLTVIRSHHLYQNSEFDQALHSHIPEWTLLDHYLSRQLGCKRMVKCGYACIPAAQLELYILTSSQI